MATETLEVRIVGDSSKLNSALKSAHTDLGKVEGAASKLTGAGGKLSGALDQVGLSGSKAGSLLSGGLTGGAIAAGVALGKMAADGVKSLLELEKITAQTNATIAATGGAANVTQAHVAALGDKLEKLTGIDSQVIQSGENMLLTFTNIRNAAGKGNDIFDQSTKILTDMSVVFKTDAAGAAIQLGKALNDPIQGITALTRVGVAFTQQQKDQIAAMVASGDTLGAQKIILAELTREFGGVAEAIGQTTGGKIERLKREFEDVEEGLASGLIPVLDNVSSAFLKIGGEGQTLGKTIGDVVSGAFINLAPAVGGLSELFDVFSGKNDKAKEAADKVADAQKGVAGATDEATAAVTANTEALDAQAEATFAALGGALSAEEAQLRFAESADKASESLLKNGAASNEARGALINAQQAALGAASAAVRLAEDQAKARGGTLSAKEATQIQIDTLGRLAGSLAPGSALRVQLEGFIRELERVKSKDVTVRVNYVRTGQAPGDPTGMEGPAGPRHQGGVVAGGALPARHVGGMGPDESLVRFQAGEGVLRRSAMAKLGVGGLNALNSGQFGGGGGGGGAPVVVQVMLDGRVIAEVVREQNDRTIARGGQLPG